MTTSDFRFGFRIVGKTCEPRRLVDAGAAFAAYAACDPRAECQREAYLSAFRFGEDFRRLLLETGSTAGFAGPCWSPWLWFDIDRPDLASALKDARRLALAVDGRYCPADDDLLIFFSGSKGFHLGLPTAFWSPVPCLDFHRTARRFAEHVAELAAVAIDTGVYDRVRAFRAPNSRHPKTGLHKRRLTLDELTGLSLDAILTMAKEPAPFDLPTPTGISETAAADWQAAVALVASEAEAKAARRAEGSGMPTLNRSTLNFIREGATTGDRHRLLFSAAANLAEFGCSPALAVALLEEAGLDSGLAPKDVRRQIECGLGAVRSSLSPEPTQQTSPESTQAAPDGSTVQEPLERNSSDSGDLEGQSCQQVTRLPDPTPTVDLQAELTKLWGTPPTAAPAGQVFDRVAGRATMPATLPPLPPALAPLAPGAVGSGKLDKPCKCGSREFVDVAISEGRSRRDCRKCGRFVGWGKWYDQGGPTP